MYETKLVCCWCLWLFQQQSTTWCAGLRCLISTGMTCLTLTLRTFLVSRFHPLTSFPAQALMVSNSCFMELHFHRFEVSSGCIVIVWALLSSIESYFHDHLFDDQSCSWSAGVVPDMHARQEPSLSGSRSAWQELTGKDAKLEPCMFVPSSQQPSHSCSPSDPVAAPTNHQIASQASGLAYQSAPAPAEAGYHAAIVHAHHLFQSCYGVSPAGGFMPAAVPVWGAFPLMCDVVGMDERPMAREARVLR